MVAGRGARPRRAEAHPTDPPAAVAADFAKKLKVDVAGLSDAQIEERVKDLVIKGEGMPRALHQSIEPFRLPSVVE